MITVHHLKNSRSTRIIWLLEELGLDYELKTYDRDGKTNLAPPEIKALHPLGKAPLLTDKGETYAETGAIVDYILDTYGDGNLRPKIGAPERAAYNYWFHAAEGSLMPLLVMGLFFGKMETAPPFFMRPFIKPVTGQVRKLYLTPTTQNLFNYIEAELGKSVWFAGAHVTAADIMMSFPLEAAAGRAGLNENYPNVQAYLKRLRALPAYQRAIETGGEIQVVGSE